MRNLKLIKTIDLSEIWRQIRTELFSDDNDICIFNDHCEGNYHKISFDAADEAVLVALAKFMYAHTGSRAMHTMKLAAYDSTISKSILDLRKQDGIINININSEKANLVFDALSLYQVVGHFTMNTVAAFNNEVEALFKSTCSFVAGEYMFKWHDDATYSTLVELLNKLEGAILINTDGDVMDDSNYPILHKWFRELDRIIHQLNHHAVESDSICYENTVGLMMLLAIFLYTVLTIELNPLKLRGLALISSLPVLDIDEYSQGQPHTFHSWDSSSITNFWDVCVELSAARGVDICTKNII